MPQDIRNIEKAWTFECHRNWNKHPCIITTDHLTLDFRKNRRKNLCTAIQIFGFIDNAIQVTLSNNFPAYYLCHSTLRQPGIMHKWEIQECKRSVMEFQMLTKPLDIWNLERLEPPWAVKDSINEVGKHQFLQILELNAMIGGEEFAEWIICWQNGDSDFRRWPSALQNFHLSSFYCKNFFGFTNSADIPCFYVQ